MPKAQLLCIYQCRIESRRGFWLKQERKALLLCQAKGLGVWRGVLWQQIMVRLLIRLRVCVGSLMSFSDPFNLFFFFDIFIYLAALGLSYGTWDLSLQQDLSSCGVWLQSMWAQ